MRHRLSGAGERYHVHGVTEFGRDTTDVLDIEEIVVELARHTEDTTAVAPLRKSEIDLSKSRGAAWGRRVIAALRPIGPSSSINSGVVLIRPREEKTVGGTGRLVRSRISRSW